VLVVLARGRPAGISTRVPNPTIQKDALIRRGREEGKHLVVKLQDKTGIRCILLFPIPRGALRDKEKEEGGENFLPSPTLHLENPTTFSGKRKRGKQLLP